MLPTNEEFIESGLSHLITSRVALANRYQTKGELMERLAEIEDDDGLALMDGFIAAKEFFSHFVKFLEAAEARIIVAGSSVCQNTPEKCGQRGREWGNA